ncbi:MAG: lipopolysaccharide biosynthesis protein [Bacteroidia bacterium]|nr:lipopolysaccharide biosynthesis protein [Bacteroidia bacterium]
MGTVKKASLYSTILQGIGILLGFLISGVLLPNYLSEDQNGVISLLNSYSLIYSQIAILGVHTAVIKFYPHFKNDSNRHHGFLSMVTLILLVSFLIFTLYYYLSKPYFKETFNNSPLFRDNYFYILPLTFFTLYFTLFDNYSTAILKPVRGFLYRDVIQRLLVLTCIGTFIFYKLNFNFFLFLYVVALCLPTVLFVSVLLKENHFTWKIKWYPLYRDNWRYMAKLSGYSLLLGLAWVGANNIDSIMIERMIDLKSAGIYSRNMFFGILVAIPYRAIHKVSSGVIAQAFKDNDINQIKSVYYKSTLTQLIIGSFIFCGIWLNIHNVYKIIPASYEDGKYVIFFIGLGNLSTMIGGVNTAIINFSPYYRWNSYFVAILLIAAVGLNFVFIPIWGVSGAASATALCYLGYNFMMWVLLKKKYQFQPFNKSHLIAIIVIIVCYFIAYLIPVINNFTIDVLVRSTVFTALYASIILKTNLSPDINKLVTDIFNQAIRIVKKEKKK